MQNQLLRVFEIDRRVRAKTKPTPEELARDLKVSRRQIFYDRNRLIELGAPLEHENGGWVYRDASFVLPTSILTEGELLAFFLAVEIARAVDAPLAVALGETIEKLRRALGEPVTVDLNALAQTTFALPPAAHAENARCLELMRAKSARRRVKMRYFSASSDQTTTRTVHPYHLHYARGEWILIAHDERRAGVRCFNIARIRELETLDARFEIALTFDATAFVNSMLCAEAGDVLHQIAVRFDSYQARYIDERTYHVRQTKETQPDGGLILRFPASGLAEVARWVMGFGQHAQALEPPELVTIISSHVEKMGQIYGGKTDE